MSDTTLPPIEFATGFAPLPGTDILGDGALEYNDVTFSSLFGSKLDWVVEQANDSRSAKWVKVTIEAAGVVTLGFNAQTIDSAMMTIRRNLAQDGGILRYTGRGFGTDMVINQPGGRKDLNWGPKTETLSFEPLGQGLGAMVHWRVTTWVSEMEPGGANIVQFNNEVSIAFDEEFYAGLIIKGTLEIGLTRVNAQTRTLTSTVDDLRQQWMTFIANSIDLRHYRVIKRNFNVSRDRRILEWEFAATELPPVTMPPAAPTARGSFRFQPVEKGIGHLRWLCSLRVTYNVDKRYPRRTAYFHFIVLLWFRMMHSRIFGILPATGTIDTPFGPAVPVAPLTAAQIGVARRRAAALLQSTDLQLFTPNSAIPAMENFLRTLRNRTAGLGTPTALLISVTGDEGLYLDGKTVTYEAQWKFFCQLSEILIGTGFQRYPRIRVAVAATDNYRDPWAITMQNIAGWKSYLAGSLDPAGSAIIDFGTNAPPNNGVLRRE
jgi:hypothetical protein